MTKQLTIWLLIIVLGLCFSMYKTGYFIGYMDAMNRAQDIFNQVHK